MQIHKIKKCLLVVALLMCAFCVGTGTAFAAQAEQVTINNTTLDAENPYYKNGGTYGTASDYNAFFDAEDGVLTIRNLDVQTYRRSGIVSAGDLILVLEGDNYVKITCSVNDNKVYFHGIEAENLTIRGSGSLTIPYVQGNYGRQNTYGIRATNLLIESGEVDVSYAYDAGLSASSISITGGVVSTPCGSNGIIASNIDISGGQVTAYGFSSGIRATRSLKISGGTVTTGRRSNETSDYGIQAPVFSMTGGTVSAYAAEAGLSCSNGFYHSGGSLTIYAESTYTWCDRLGIYSGSGEIYLSGGRLEIFSSSGAFNENTIPVVSSCCSYYLKQGEDEDSASSITASDLDGSSLYFYAYCRSKDHTPEEIPAVDPTCTQDGSTACTECSKCGHYLIAPITVYKVSHQYTETNTDEKFLKSAATCTQAARYYHSCVCGAIANGTYNTSTFVYGKPLPHTPEVDEAVPPTCGDTGLTEGSHCLVCKTVITAQTVVPATGEHGYRLDSAVKETCTTAGLTAGASCPNCNFVFIVQDIIPATGHKAVVDEAVAATCSSTGWTEGSHCGVCNEVLEAQESVPTIPHTPVIDPAVEPSCTKMGWTEGSHCDVCKQTIVKQTEVAKAPHSVVIVDPVEPTCTKEGLLNAGMYCDVCEEVLVAQEIVPALGHRVIVESSEQIDPLTVENQSAVPFVLADGTYYSNNHSNSSSSEIRIAAKYDCSLTLRYGVSSEQNYDKLIIQHNSAQKDAISGIVSDKAMVLNLMAGDTVVVRYTKDVSMNKNDDCGWVSLVYEKLTEYTDVPADSIEADCANEVVCSYCDAVVKEALSHTPGAAATCTAAQICTVCSTELTAAKGHDEVSHEAKAPTCTEIGWEAYETCSRCDYTTYEEKAALTHDEVSHEAKAPTCTEIGWEAYETCSRCDYTTYEETAALGHNHSYQVIDGEFYYACENCSDRESACDVKRNEQSVCVKLGDVRPIWIYGVMYDAEGRVVEVSVAQATRTETTVSFSETGDCVKVFFLDEDLAPWLKAVEV